MTPVGPDPIVRRPVLRYHGGKWRIAPWIIRHMPAHTCYVEPFGGGASVLLRKPRCPIEVYNDLDGEVVNVFRVLRDPEAAAELAAHLRLTPYARREFADAHPRVTDPIEAARRTLVRAWMGIGSNSLHRGRGSRASGFRVDSQQRVASEWAGYPAEIPEYVARLRGVVIEDRPATEIIPQYDSRTTLFYCDPPYVRSARTSDDARYTYEMTDDDHRALATVLHQVRGMVLLSGYACALYDALYGQWASITRQTAADAGCHHGTRYRTETLWANPAGAHMLADLWSSADARD